MGPATGAELRVVEVTDERSALARAALALIQDAIWDVHPMGSLLRELEDTRKGRANGGGYHLLALVTKTAEDTPLAAATGCYLQAVNAGFVSYLAVHEDWRGHGLGGLLRERLLDAFRAQALRERGEPLGRVVGEVERSSGWLRALVREGKVVPLDFPYFHPWMSRSAEGKYALYLEPQADPRRELPAREVAALLEAVWRRAYRVRDPEQSELYRLMLERLGGRSGWAPRPTCPPHPPSGRAPRRAGARAR